MLRQNCCWVFLFVLLLPRLSWSQARLNLALEASANRRQPLLLWSRQTSPGVQLSFDTVTFAQGRSSLRLDLSKATVDTPYAQLYTLFSFPLDSARGHLVTVSAAVRTQSFEGQAGVYAYAHTPDEGGKNRADNVALLPANQAWHRLEVTLPVKATATAFGLGLRVGGRGQIWFDQVEVRVDGRLFQDTPQPGTEALLLTAEELQLPTWDFEQLPPVMARPAPAQIVLGLDSLQPQQGRRSLSVALQAARPAGAPRPVVYLGTLPVAKMRGKLLTVTGYWKQAPASGSPEDAPAAESMTPTARPAFTYTLLGNDGRSGSPPQWIREVVELPTAPPTAAWTAFTLTIPVPNDEFLYGVSLGVRPANHVPLLLDNLQFRLDGRPYVPAALSAAAPTPSEVAWLRKSVLPLLVTSPRVGSPPDAPDMSVLGPLIGNARVVGLGEVTHGSSSIFEMKHRLVRYLVEQKGFTGFMLESSADCEPLNQFLQTGQGDPVQLVRRLGVYSTQEVLAVVRYLRTHNQQPGAAKVQLVGMDMQMPENALAYLQQAARPHDAFVQAQLREIAAVLAQIPRNGGGPPIDLSAAPQQPTDPLLQALLRLTHALRTGLDTRFKLVHDPDWTSRDQARFLFELRRLEQGAIFRRLPMSQGAAYRDACLAENVEALSQCLSYNGTPAKLAVWAHNAHVAASALYEYPMGKWLKARYGSSYLALGFAFGQGTYTAEGAGAFYPAQAQPARAGTYEAWFQATGIPAFVLDVRQLKPNKDGTWLFEQQLFRDLGIQEARRNFTVHELAREFDAVLFLQHSTATQRLK